MDPQQIIMILGFLLASYSVVGNDVIQTLGTFLSSNETKRPWYVLWAFASIIMVAVLVYGQYQVGDISYGRLAKIDFPDMNWWYVLPPLVLLLITRLGIPVSTTFLILTFFSAKSLPGMIQKSVMGYLIAFGAAIVIYMVISKVLEKRFIDNPITEQGTKWWTVAQWLSTGFLWSQWLTQDLANIYIYLNKGEGLSHFHFALTVLALVGLLGYIFYSKGGAVQKIVKAKTNTTDIRSATIVDLIYGVVLLIFKYNMLGLWEAKLPMSTTWVFIGLLAGREIAIRLRLDKKITGATLKDVGTDLAKVGFGLLVSVGLVYFIKAVENL